MSEKVKDGGPAFPGMAPMAFGQESGHLPGMSLLDWFAGQALAGMLCRAVHEDFDILAANSYAAAAAMLTARQKDTAP